MIREHEYMHSRLKNIYSAIRKMPKKTTFAVYSRVSTTAINRRLTNSLPVESFRRLTTAFGLESISCRARQNPCNSASKACQKSQIFCLFFQEREKLSSLPYFEYGLHEEAPTSANVCAYSPSQSMHHFTVILCKYE